jgi:hypothetical protein
MMAAPGLAERNETRTEKLFAESSAPMQALDAFLEAALPTVSARLWETCSWPESMADGWKIGDYNFLIITTSPDPNTSLYVQFWSEPHEEVLVEISSGHRNPGAVRYMRDAQRRAVQALGYRVTGAAGNYGRTVRVSSASEAESVGKDALQVFWDVFNYRGQWPLSLEGHKGERAERQPVYSAVTPEDVLKLAIETSYNAVVALDQDSPPSVLLARGRNRSIAQMIGQVPKQNLFSGFVLMSSAHEGRLVGEAELRALRENLVDIRVETDKRGMVRARMDVLLDGGVSARWLMNRLELWHAGCRRFERLTKRFRSRRSSTRRGREKTPKKVH